MHGFDRSQSFIKMDLTGSDVAQGNGEGAATDRERGGWPLFCRSRFVWSPEAQGLRLALRRMKLALAV